MYHIRLIWIGVAQHLGADWTSCIVIVQFEKKIGVYISTM
jgi:hypothetical protein